jgi:DNA topoisomerase-1
MRREFYFFLGGEPDLDGRVSGRPEAGRVAEVIASELAASAASLTFVSDEQAGIRRRKAGSGFSYRDANGNRVVDDRTRARIRSLAVPPAWTDVWICADPHGHLQATGRDARGRKQYRYHPDWRELCEADKYEHLLDFGRVLPRIRRTVRRDLQLRGFPRERALATVVGLLESTMIRVGNEEYARTNASYGLTTLRSRHVRDNGGELTLVFRGKSNIEHQVTVEDPRLARIIRRLQDLPGQHLIQYVDDNGTRRPVQSEDVNEYLRTAAGADVTAKDFRTWMGTLLTAQGLAAIDRPESDREAKRMITSTIAGVAAQLGNTTAVCRRCYVHPAVLEHFLAGDLRELWANVPGTPKRDLRADEHRLLGILRPRASRSTSRRAAA